MSLGDEVALKHAHYQLKLPGLEHWQGSFSRVPGQDKFLSYCLSLYGIVNGFQHPDKMLEVTWQLTTILSKGSSNTASYLKCDFYFTVCDPN